ncbi:M1 family aminopeptidase [Silvibacterium acidisoli]|uniref:M1 family aminopeptidase n=1 Tax=Acidobacteriaceae bacterium ZG23-2 TaxID=2883246 RepID=UPI00406BECDD
MHKFSGRTFFGLLLVALCSSSFSAHAQRLPQTVHPEHYRLRLTPDLAKATFEGEEEIDVLLDDSTDAITLNAAEIKFHDVTTDVDGRSLKAEVSEDTDKEQATFHFLRSLPKGRITLHVNYSGILNDQLRGFYLSKTAKRNYAVTQFEPTDARRAFPSFDEPAYKATFDVSLTVDKNDTAISNTNIVSDKPGPVIGQHTIRFATTPKMSTYLVAFLVGDFQCVSGSSDGVPIRSCATPDKVQYSQFALEAAEFVLHYYDTYFGIKYPMPKLDMIALPDFEAGAMENFGAITYRETDLLINEKTATINAKRNVGLVVAHEMAHQWFGDMVTMQWWNNLWLNEGFASWMENKPIAAWHPEWNIHQQVAATLQSTLNLDAQRTTRTIRAEADTPDQINEMFDGITYDKGSAILLMMENYEGEETFRQGVHNYLQAHMYGNATAEDFWGAQTAISHKPIDKIMANFIAQPGVPMLSFAAPQSGSVQVSQHRFFLSPEMKATEQSWLIPVCVKSADGKAQCDVLSGQNGSVKVPDAPLFFADAEGKGYYRSAYTPEVFHSIVANMEQKLTPAERISVLGDEWARVQANQASVADYLDLAASVKDDTNAPVMKLALGNVSAIQAQIAATPQEQQAIADWVRKNFKPALDRLGQPSAQDSSEKRELRAELFQALGESGRDQQVLAEAKKLAEAYQANSDSVEPTLGRAALAVAVYGGDGALFDQLQKTSETSPDPVVQEGALHLLAQFQDPALAKRSLEYAASGKVRNQDAVFQFTAALRSPGTRELAWDYVQQNWDKVKAQLTTMAGGRLVGAAGSFCSADKRDAVLQFFSTHPVHASANALERAKNNMNDCIDLRASQEPKLKEWIAKQ